MAVEEIKALDWDSPITVPKGGNFELLDEGAHPFTVVNFDRERFEGSPKMPACPRAKLTLEVESLDGDMVTVYDRIMLSTKTLWRVAQFFESLGFEEDENGQMNIDWEATIGKSGMCIIKHRKYTNKDGEEKTTNDVDKYVHAKKAAKEFKKFEAAKAAAEQAEQQGEMTFNFN